LPRRTAGAAADFDPYGMPCDDSLDPLLRDLEGLRAELTEVEARVARIQAAQGEFGPGEFSSGESDVALFDGNDGNRNGSGQHQPAQSQSQPAAE
jgi:hypothetical protein